MRRLIILLLIINFCILALSNAMEVLDEEVIFFSAVIESLGKIGDKKAVDPLIKILKDVDPTLREKAVKALGEIGDKRAVEPLKAVLLKDKYIQIRKSAAIALDKLSWRPENELERTYFLLVKERWAEIKEIKPFISELKSDSPIVRQEAIEILGKIRDKRAATALINAFKDEEEPLVRKEIVKALGDIKDGEAVDILITALEDRDWGVRLFSAEALSEIVEPKVRDALYNALQYEHSKVRMKIIEALAKIGDKRAAEPLITILKNEGWYEDRKKAAELLGSLGDKRSIPPLVSSLKDKSLDVRKISASSLKKLNWQPKDNREKVYFLLAKGEGEKISEIKEIDFLVSDLKDKDPSIRWMAAEALSEIANIETLDNLIKALRDENAKVRMYATKALSKIKDEKSIIPLINCLEDKKSYIRPFEYEEVLFRIYAIKALGNIGDKKAIEPLSKLMAEELISSEKREIVIALEKLGCEPKNSKEKFNYFWDKNKISNLVRLGYSDIGTYPNDTWNEQIALDELKKHIDFFIPYLKDKDSKMRQKAALILARIGSDKAIESLRDILGGNEEWLKSQVTQLLDENKIKYKKEDKIRIDDLLKSLKDKELGIRINAAIALAKMGDKRAAVPLIEILRTRKTKNKWNFWEK